LIGNSSGAFGALDIAIRNPKLFAAVVSICGGFDAADAKKLKKVSLRMYHGTEDDVVPVALSRDFYYELKANGAAKVELLEYPGFKHDILDSVLGSEDFLEWIFSKEK
jgi:predicted peptidase